MARGGLRERGEGRVGAPVPSGTPRSLFGLFLVCTVKGWSVGWGFVSFSVLGVDGPFRLESLTLRAEYLKKN